MPLARSSVGSVLTTSFQLVLGDHAVRFDVDAVGTSPASVTLNTQLSGSTLLVAQLGQFANLSAPTDNKGNTLSMIQDNPGYAGGLWGGFGLRLYGKTNAVGGASHTVSFTKALATQESTIQVAEIRGAGTIQASSIVARAAAGVGVAVVSASVTTTGSARLISFWAGDGFNISSYVADPEAGWTALDSFWLSGSSAYIQAAFAVRNELVPAGTYTVAWTPVASQGAIIGLIAMQA